MFGLKGMKGELSVSRIRLNIDKKYRLWDEDGNVMPDLDDVFFNEYFVAMKRDRVWKVAKISDGITNIKYEAQEVMLYEDVMWYKQNGVWKAVDTDGNVLLEGKYISVKPVGKALMELRTKEGFHVEYFSTKGKRLSEDNTITHIQSEYLRYAMAFGYENASKKEKYYIVNVDSGVLFNRSFDDEETCEMFLQELRDDWIWSRQ